MIYEDQLRFSVIRYTSEILGLGYKFPVQDLADSFVGGAILAGVEFQRSESRRMASATTSRLFFGLSSEALSHSPNYIVQSAVAKGTNTLIVFKS